MSRFRFSLSEAGLPRFFAPAGFSVFAGSLAGVFLGKELSIGFSAALMLLGLGLLIAKRKASFVCVVLLSLSLELSLFALSYTLRAEPYLPLSGKEAELRGTVLDDPEEEYHKYYYSIRVTELFGEDGKPAKTDFRIRLSSAQPLSCGPGTVFTGCVKFYSFSEDGLYSAKNSNFARGVLLGAFVSDFQSFSFESSAGKSMETFWPYVRQHLKRCISRLLPREPAALVRAMLLGDRSGLSEEVKSDFRKIGASHLLVVSGLHLSALCTFLLVLVRLLPIGRVGRNLLAAGAILLFLCLLGFPFSAVRSGVMLLLFLAADSLGREPDSLNSLGFAVFLICLQNPFAAGDAGLSLSVLSTLGILTLHPILYGGVKRRLEKLALWRFGLSALWGSLSVSICAMAFTLPVQLLVFGGLSFLAPLSSLLLVLPCTLLLYSGALCLGLSAAGPLAPAALPFAFLSGVLSKGILWGVQALGRIPVSFLPLSTQEALFVLGFSAVSLCFFRLCKKDRVVKTVSICLPLAVLLLAGLIEGTALSGGVTMAVLNEGSSSCVILMKDREAAVLTLGGYRTSGALSVLETGNIRKLALLHLSEDSQEACEAAQKLLRRYEAEEVWAKKELYLGKNWRYILKKEPDLYEKTTRLSPFDGVTLSLEEDRIVVFASGKKIIIEEGGSGRESCDVLITSQRKSRASASLVILETEEELKGEALSETCLPTCEGRLIRLKLDGENVLARREY